MDPETLRQLLEHVPIVLFALDTEMHVTLAEGGGVEALGHRPGELIGRRLTDLCSGPFVEAVSQALAGKVIRLVVEAREKRLYETHCLPRRNAEGAIIGVTGVATEVGESVRAEHQLTHAINNPLTYALLNLATVARDLARMSDLSQRARLIELLGEAQSGLDRLAHVVANRFPLEAPPPGDARSGVRRPRVLVIDDEPMLGRAIAEALPQYEVDAVVDGTVALDRVARGTQYDLILCDLTMPGLGGREVHAALADRHPRLAERMLFMTGGTVTSETSSFAADMRHRILTKPFDLKRLQELVRARLRVDG